MNGSVAIGAAYGEEVPADERSKNGTGSQAGVIPSRGTTVVEA